MQAGVVRAFRGARVLLSRREAGQQGLVADEHLQRVFVKVVLVAALVSLTLPTLHSQALPDRPGSSRPIQLRTPRIAPIPTSTLTAAQREQIARIVAPGTSPGNGIRTLLN